MSAIGVETQGVSIENKKVTPAYKSPDLIKIKKLLMKRRC